MDKNKSRAIGIIVVVVILVVLFMLPRFTDGSRKMVTGWNDMGVDCLAGHENANLHIHPILKITVNGKSETVPANIGIVRSCMAEVHTHDASGTIHIESVAADKTFTLEQFFGIWGMTLERDGYTVAMIVDGKANTEMGALLLKDHQEISLSYTKVSAE